MTGRKGGVFMRCDVVGKAAHSGGINVALGDGSVRFVARGISATVWAYANDPKDGQDFDW